MKKHVFKPRRVGFDDEVVRHSYDDDGVVSVNTGGITSFSAGVDGVGTVSDDDAPVVHKRIAFVSGDVRVVDRNLPDHAGGDTCFPVRVNEGDAVGVHTSGPGGLLHLLMLMGVVLYLLLLICRVMLTMCSPLMLPHLGGLRRLCNTLVLCGKWHGMATPRVHLVCIVPLYSTHVLLSRWLIRGRMSLVCYLPCCLS